MTTKRVAGLMAALVGAAAVGLAAPASAELSDGTYDMASVDGKPSDGLQMVVTSCGAGCKRTTIHGGAPLDYHLEGTTWSSVLDGNGLFSTIDNDSLVYQSGSGRFVFMTRQLVKVD
ncbi:hypothetical protein [Mycolicibacter heraklionensis]|uniref:hypothetical protein n=1 Tax=Mycolicibacter heraklionensis TaxID=512402 RepID=UPI000B254FE3|nr:hypothetical protein [Mycolicibacter heraklionensis]